MQGAHPGSEGAALPDRSPSTPHLCAEAGVARKRPMASSWRAARVVRPMPRQQEGSMVGCGATGGGVRVVGWWSGWNEFRRRVDGSFIGRLAVTQYRARPLGTPLAPRGMHGAAARNSWGLHAPCEIYPQGRGAAGPDPRRWGLPPVTPPSLPLRLPPPHVAPEWWQLALSGHTHGGRAAGKRCSLRLGRLTGLGTAAQRPRRAAAAPAAAAAACHRAHRR